MADPDLTAIDQAMSPRKPDGGPASGGMSLRDYFAAHAPTMPKTAFLDLERGNESGAQWMAKRLARWAYAYADAMLAEREKREGPP